jgi:hypothetical protein
MKLLVSLITVLHEIARIQSFASNMREAFRAGCIKWMPLSASQECRIGRGKASIRSTRHSPTHKYIAVHYRYYLSLRMNSLCYQQEISAS